MYPEIRQYNILLNLEFDTAKNAYILKFNKGEQELITYLDKKDADARMNNIKCIYLGVQVEQFINNFEGRK